MFNGGHMSEHLIWAPDARDDLAFTMYAMDCEHEKAAREAREAMGQTNQFFRSANALGDYLRSAAPNAYTQLSESDIIDLWYTQQ